MKRVLQVTLLLSGILLVVVAANLMRHRASHDPTDILLMTAIRNGRDSVYLVGASPHQVAWRAIGPKYAAFSPKGRSPDGKWFYLMESDYRNTLGIPYAENVRVRSNGTEVERLAGVNITGSMFWSGAWVYYSYYDPNLGQSDFYRASTTTHQVENLTANFQWSVNVGDYMPPVFDPQGTWVIFAASDMNGLSAIYRLDLTTSQFDDLTPPGGQYASLMGASSDTTWVIFSLDTVIYRMRPDGSELTQIFAGGNGYVNLWPQANLLLVSVYQQNGTDLIYAVDLDDGRVYWKVDNLLMDSLPHQATFFMRDRDNWLYQADADRTPPRRVLQLPSSAMSSTWQSPEGRWLMLTQTLYDAAQNFSAYVLSGLRLSDGAIIEFYRSSQYFTVVGWTAHDEAMFIESYDTGPRDLWRVEMATGQKTRILHEQRYGYFLGIVGKRNWAGRPVMLGVGLAIIGAVVGRWAWRKRRGLKIPGYEHNVGVMPTSNADENLDVR